MAPKKVDPLKRMLAQVTITDTGCMQWTGWVERHGYARLWVDGKNVSAHRWSYERHVGPIPEGLVIDHLCRNRACVNPEHLEPVTPAENTRRGVMNPHNANKTHCPQGHPYSEDNTYRDSRGRSCWTCKREQRKQHYVANRQKYIDRAAAWHAANPERAREIARDTARARRARQKAS